METALGTRVKLVSGPLHAIVSPTRTIEKDETDTTVVTVLIHKVCGGADVEAFEKGDTANVTVGDLQPL